MITANTVNILLDMKLSQQQATDKKDYNFFRFHSALFLTSFVFDFDSLWHTNFMSSTARTLKLQLKPLPAGTTVTHTAS